MDMGSKARYRALRLNERAYKISQTESITLSDIEKNRIKWWIEKFFYGRKSIFKKYLSHFEIDYDSLPFLIGASNQDASASPFPWDNASKSNLFTADLTNPAIESPQFGFENLCEPTFTYAHEKMSNAIDEAQTNGLRINKNQVLTDFDFYLRQKLAPYLTPSFILEANISRIKSSNLSESAGERLEAFVQSYKLQSNRQKFWNKYPALWRLVSNISLNSTNACVETICHLGKDHKEIQIAFSYKKPISVQSISWGNGDAHCKGRVVSIITCDDGRFVCKPRSLEADKTYNEFITWFTSVSNGLCPSAYKILDCGSYGYTPFIEYKNCTSPREAKEFYYKLGMLLAISWLLGITDLHSENLIASGADPYLIDVEMILERPSPHSGSEYSFKNLYFQACQGFLFRTGLLPYRMLGPAGVYDLSAIGAHGQQASPMQIAVLENSSRDDVKMVLKQGIIEQAQNIPLLDGRLCNPSEYVEEVISGFENAMDMLKKHRASLASLDSILNAFRNVPVRWVARFTRYYFILTQKMAHPSVLMDAADCEMLMGGEFWSQLNYSAKLAKLIPSEIEDIWEGDVPYFHTTPQSRDLYDSRGNIFKNFFKYNGLHSMRQRVKSLGETKGYQTESIRLALMSTAISADSSPHTLGQYPRMDSRTDAGKISKRELVNAAEAIGWDIYSKAHFVNGVPLWVGMLPLDDKNFAAQVLPPSFYDGTPGIGLFFGYLYKFVKKEEFKKIALDIHNYIRLLLGRQDEISSCGAFNGLGGLIYADLHLSVLFGRDPAPETNHSLKCLKQLVEQDNQLDVIGGSAGALLIALRYYSQTNNLEALNIASAAAEKLFSAAEPNDVGVSWNTVKSQNYRLGGLSHGVTGIAWALSDWAQYTGDHKYAELVRKAFAYEQSLFDQPSGTWKDLRSNTPSCLWCHGAVGIGIAVNNMRKTMGNKICDETIRLAQNATWKYGFCNNHCICHGTLGNSELFLITGDIEKANVMASYALNDYKKKGRWECGLPAGATTPSLMTGLAGIGYGLLRHALPTKMPSILNLECPQKI